MIRQYLLKSLFILFPELKPIEHIGNSGAHLSCLVSDQAHPQFVQWLWEEILGRSKEGAGSYTSLLSKKVSFPVSYSQFPPNILYLWVTPQSLETVAAQYPAPTFSAQAWGIREKLAFPVKEASPSQACPAHSCAWLGQAHRAAQLGGWEGSLLLPSSSSATSVSVSLCQNKCFLPARIHTWLYTHIDLTHVSFPEIELKRWLTRDSSLTDAALPPLRGGHLLVKQEHRDYGEGRMKEYGGWEGEAPKPFFLFWEKTDLFGRICCTQATLKNCHV